MKHTASAHAFIYENIYDHILFTLFCLWTKDAQQAAPVSQYLVTMVHLQLTALLHTQVATWQVAFP